MNLFLFFFPAVSIKMRQIEVIEEHYNKKFKEKVNEFMKSHKVISTAYDFPTPILWRHGPSQTLVGDKSPYRAIIEYEVE